MVLQLYGLAGFATIAWVLLMILPGWRVTRWLAESAVFPIFLCAIYTVGIVTVLGATGFGLLREFGSAEGVLRILTMPDIALVAWIHLLAFDQFVGLYIYRDNMRHRYVPVTVQSLVLLMTFMLGPLGLLTYLLVRAARRAPEVARQGWASAAKVADPFPSPANSRERVTRAAPPAFGAASDPMLDHRIASLPSPLAAPIDYVRAVWLREEPALSAVGALGLVLGAVVGLIQLVRGDVIPPEGVLSKAMSFDVALGIYTLSLALLVPLARFRVTTLRLWRGTLIAFTAIALGIETVQILRGFDPRFSKAGGSIDNVIGMFFGSIAVGMIVLFWILGMRFFDAARAGTESNLVLAIRYGVASTMLAFGAGLAMTTGGGRTIGESGNWMALHALGFHALQAVPLVAWIVSRAPAFAGRERPWIHAAGITWFVSCLAVGVQTVAGIAITTPTPVALAAYVALAGWMLVTGAALARSRARTGVSATASKRPSAD